MVPTAEAPYRRRLDTAFRQAGVEPPQHLVESLSVLVNARLLQESDMLGVMPHSVAQQYADAGTLRILPTRLPPPSGPVGVISAAGPQSPAAAAFLSTLRETVHELPRAR